MQDDAFLRAFDAWTDAFARFVAGKGKVEPGKYRAYGHVAPSHRWADVKLKWREIRMGLGIAPAGSSPRRQHALGANRDAVLDPGRSEGDRLRGR